MTGGARVRGARRSRAPAAGGTRQLGTRRLVLSSQEARFRPWRPTAPRSVQVWSSLSSGDLEKPERPAPTSFEREAPEPIPEISLDDASRSPAPVADEDQYGSTVYDKDPEAVAKDLDLARECMHQEKKVSVSILRLNKAGVVCKFSDVLEAFVPVAQLSSYTRQFYREEWVGFGNEATVARDQTRRRGSKSLVGENIDACVIGVRDQQDEGFGQKHMVVMSEKKAEELGASEIFDVTERGDVVECYVKTVTHFGIFVKLGAIDALIHKSQVWLPEMEEETV